MAAGLPDPPAATLSAPSMTVTFQPRIAIRAATLAPATPAPITRAVFSVRLMLGRCSQGVMADVVDDAVRVPRSISRFCPWPGTFSTENPAACNPLLTCPAAVKVANVVCGLLSSTMFSKS